MFCKNCGREIDDKAVVCPQCGVAVAPLNTAAPAETKETNTLAIVGFILSFFIAIAGLICSIIGYRNAPQFGGKGKGLALAGIIISVISMVVVLIYFIILIAAIAAL